MTERYIKLAFFGDSYADSGPLNSKFYEESYFHRLSKMFEDLESPITTSDTATHAEYEYCPTGRAGTNAYWGYTQFKKMAQQENTILENALITLTDTNRLPITNNFFATASWINMLASDLQGVYSLEYQNAMIDTTEHVEYWNNAMTNLGVGGFYNLGGYSISDVFAIWNLFFENNFESFDTVRFINRQTLRCSAELAKNENINLVVIIPFESSVAEYLTEYPEITDTHLVITGLDEVSHRETKTWPDDPLYNTTEKVEWRDNHVDVRCNHLCNINNKILADLVWEGFNGGKTGLVTLAHQPGLDYTEIEKYAIITHKS